MVFPFVSEWKVFSGWNTFIVDRLPIFCCYTLDENYSKHIQSVFDTYACER